MLKTFFTFSLGTIFGVLLARRVHNFFQFEGVRRLAACANINKRVLLNSSPVEEQRRP